MAPRSASRCCRAVYGGLACPYSSNASISATTQSDSIWITDLVLASAFTTYCSRTTSVLAPPGTARRFASNVPGPLESRRRLGRRQMTDQLNLQLSLHPAGAVPPPIWALPNSPDLRQWQWTPPRDTIQGLRQADSTGSGTFIFPFEMPRWLTDLGSNVVDSTAAVETQPQQKESIAAQQLYGKLEVWRTEAAKLSETAFMSQLDDLCGEYQTQLRLAALTVEEAHNAFCQIWAVLLEKGDNLDAHASLLFAAMLQGIRECPLLQEQDFGAAFWRELYVCVAQLSPRNSNAKTSTATAAMALNTLLATPPLFLSQFVDLLPLHLITIFTSHATSMTEMSANTTAAAEAQTHELAKKVAQALQHMHFESNGSFLDRTTQLLLAPISYSPPLISDDGIPATNGLASMVGPAWLLTLAHIPQVRQDYLFQTLSQLLQPIAASPPSKTGSASTETTATQSSGTTWHMRHVDMCELLLAQWISRGYVTLPVQKSFRSTMTTIFAQECDLSGHHGHRDHPAALAALALSVFWPKHSRFQCVALYLSLLRGLQARGGDAAAAKSDLVSSVTALCKRMQAVSVSPSAQSTAASTTLKLPPVAFFESLAWAMDDEFAAVHLHELHVSTYAGLQAAQDSCSSPAQQPALWSVAFWDNFADRLAAALDSGVLTASQVCYALDLPARATWVRRSFKAAQTAQTTQTTAALVPKSTTRATYKPARKSLGAATVALVEKVAVRFALDPDLTPRQALRGVEHCWYFLAAHGGRRTGSKDRDHPTSATVLRALFHLLTRDLEDAMPGRTSRLRWFLSIVEREYSSAEASISGHALERWRASAKQFRKAEEWRLLREVQNVLDGRWTTRLFK
ncbi:hypothetical protein SEPCBS57363_000712 [Sporothrix epigloea]|uniref:Uncharacterized protein n=1 Tax=Sporothrix epigloea TaxID=1892477 RepID=A0ABP0D678_9PEZI